MFNKIHYNMRLDLNQIKQLQPNEDVLVDGGYVDLDLKVIYDFYKDQDTKPPVIQEYFDTNTEYQFEDFLKVYLKSNGINSELSYTQDGWLKIQING